eukprot:2235185-Prymnesium_polylepis.2
MRWEALSPVRVARLRSCCAGPRRRCAAAPTTTGWRTRPSEAHDASRTAPEAPAARACCVRLSADSCLRVGWLRPPERGVRGRVALRSLRALVRSELQRLPDSVGRQLLVQDLLQLYDAPPPHKGAAAAPGDDAPPLPCAPASDGRVDSGLSLIHISEPTRRS